MNEKEAIIINELNTTGELFGIDKFIFEKIIQMSNSSVLIKDIKQVDYINRNYYGGRGEKIVLKINYSENNKDKETSLFIKKHCQKSPNEALHYKYLTKFNAPIPKLYAYYSKLSQQDIIITEVIKPFYVDDDPIFMLNKDILKPFIETTALFNMIKISDEYKEIISRDYDIINDKLIPFENKIHVMFNKIRTDSIYYNLKNKVSKKMEVEIINILKENIERIKVMEKGLYHWDHKPRNMGWSEIQQKHVLFDLEDTLWGPRFYNIGMWLGGDDKFEEKYTSREQLAKIYLDIYNEENKTKVSVDSLLHECYPLWIVYKIETLLIYFYESGENPYRLRNREPNEYKKEMEDKFIYILNLLCNLKKEIH
ncbi:hypothetical protein KHQ81_01070 [Mycoplasmatota bacterium]|nr:hypothetical protein KHQ81_01070 [Mycoplasmatota bacterium]